MSSSNAAGGATGTGTGNTDEPSTIPTKDSMTPIDTGFDVSGALAALRHEKKNHDLHSLPPAYTVHRRPLNHAPATNIHAGASVPKVVYVSQRTPLMSAIKRVKKILSLVEKRAMQSAGVTMGAKDRRHRLKSANDVIVKNNEEVLVKASGRAMGQALKVGEWFRNKEREYLCDVEVRTGSASVVDDIVQLSADEDEDDDDNRAHEAGKEEEPSTKDETTMVYGETTLEIMGSAVATSSADRIRSSDDSGQTQKSDSGSVQVESQQKANKPARRKKKKKNKRKRPVYEEDDVPEARLRWIKTVEVAIKLQG
ncbi:uncharacterized protein PV06_10083 [Exophiala oligosperma]|uniref:Uncharacterized protein n=2 Tax=Chaetothyriales TaxID=34395 RepID=A0A0D2D4G5_9EURO|nr:uncharacterized protein PV06_10083 [Exophiala oligosperma]KAJ9636579.1 hypothetical protein H2204_005179 [Knufia peltigerae]KIW38123.1 hypothetical protein PV06_10083 [Exophiala oligosperma]